MKALFIKNPLAICLAIAFCSLTSASCNKDSSSINNTINNVVDIGEILSTGVCNAFSVTSETARMCYVSSEKTYYIDYFAAGDGSFCFTWDKETNEIFLVECDTGLLNGYYPVYFLGQQEYIRYMGDSAEKSYYNPLTDTFVFNVMYETYSDSEGVIRSPIQITYQPKEAE